jgi:hypothetical protein
VTDVLVSFRGPYPPHRVLGATRAVENSLAYGFVLDRLSRAAFKVSRADALVDDNPDVFAFGNMVTLERTDSALPWVGYITDSDMDNADPEASFVCNDWAGALFEEARTATGWSEIELSSGEIIRRVHMEANARAEPPLLCALDAGAGPTVPFTAKGESFLAFLRDMARRTGWEWALYPTVGTSVQMRLKWTGSVGIDRSHAVAFQEGRHFKRAKIARSTDGYKAAAVAIGGSGTFRERPAAQINFAGRSDEGIVSQKSGFAAPTSPALAGTRVLIEPGVSSAEALLATARRSFTAPDYIKERLTLYLVESTIDMTKIELGSRYTVRFKTLDLGLTYERVVRAMALSLNESGVMEMVAEVQ